MVGPSPNTNALELIPYDSPSMSISGIPIIWPGGIRRLSHRFEKRSISIPIRISPITILVGILEASGDLPGAITEYEKSVALDSDPFALALLGHAQGLNGNRDAALSILKKVIASPRYVPAIPFLGLGDKDHAMDWLEKSVSQQQPDLNTIRFDPLLKALHGIPRFEALAEGLLQPGDLPLVAHPG